MFLRKLFSCLLPVLLTVGAAFLWPVLGALEIWGCVLQGVMLGVLMIFCWLTTGSYLKKGAFTALSAVPAGVLLLAIAGQLLYHFGILHWPILQLIAVTRGEKLIIEACVSTFLWGLVLFRK